MHAKICDRCKETYVPDMSETKKHPFRVSSTEGKLHLIDLCPHCLTALDRFMAPVEAEGKVDENKSTE